MLYYILCFQGYQWMKDKILSEEGRRQQAKLKELLAIAERLGCTLPQLAIGTTTILTHTQCYFTLPQLAIGTTTILIHTQCYFTLPQLGYNGTTTIVLYAKLHLHHYYINYTCSTVTIQHTVLQLHGPTLLYTYNSHVQQPRWPNTRHMVFSLMSFPSPTSPSLSLPPTCPPPKSCLSFLPSPPLHLHPFVSPKKSCFSLLPDTHGSQSKQKTTPTRTHIHRFGN